MSHLKRFSFSTKLVIFLFVCSSLVAKILATGENGSEGWALLKSDYGKEINPMNNTETSTNEITTGDDITTRTIKGWSNGNVTVPNNGKDDTASEEPTECPETETNAEGRTVTSVDKSSSEPSEEVSETGEKNEKILNVYGQCAVTFTPCDDNGNINYDVIPEYVEYLNNTGIKGILVCGITGEGPTMDIYDKKQVVQEFMTEAKKYNLKVMVQIGSNIPDELKFVTFLQDIGVDGILVPPQMYYKPKSVRQLVDYLELISDAGPELPIIYIEDPRTTGVYVNIRKLFRRASARLPKFVGVASKFSTLLTLDDLVRDDQQLIVGFHSFATDALMGFDTSISTVANVFLDQALAIIRAVKNGNFEKARELQNRLSGIVLDIEALGKEMVPIWKATMEIVTGIKMGPVRPPEQNLTEEQRRAIYGVMEKYGLQTKSRR